MPISSHETGREDLCSLPLSLRSTARPALFGWLLLELLKAGGSPCWGGELVLLWLEFPFGVFVLTWWFKYISKLGEGNPVLFLLFNLPLKECKQKNMGNDLWWDWRLEKKSQHWKTQGDQCHAIMDNLFTLVTCLSAFQDISAARLFGLPDHLHLKKDHQKFKGK